MKLKFWIPLAIALFALASCAKEEPEVVAGAVTGEAGNISCRNAEISGKANLPEKITTDLSFGVLYSTSSGVLIGTSTQIPALIFDSNYNFTVTTKTLEPSTTYYYRSYMTQSGEITYGEVKSFKTLEVSSMIQTADATQVNPNDAVLNAVLDLTNCKYESLEYGFTVTKEGGTPHNVKSTNLSEKKFSAKDELLEKDTKYSYVAYVILDGRKYSGESKTFITSSIQASINAEASDVSYHTAAISGALTVKSEGEFEKSATLYYSDTETTLEGLKSNGTSLPLELNPDGAFKAELSELPSGTPYNFVAVAKVDDIEVDGEVKSFETLEIQASVFAESSDVKCNTATISGSLTIKSEGQFEKSATLYYSDTERGLEDLKDKGKSRSLELGEDGSFEIGLTSLWSNTQYSYVVVAQVDDMELDGEVQSFTTSQIQASISAKSSDVKCKTATISGELVVSSEGTFSKSAALYHSSTENTLEGLKSNGNKQIIVLNSDGTYSIKACGLASGVTNYYCVVAMVRDAEFATAVKDFTTYELPAGAVDLGLSVAWASCNVGASTPEEYGKMYQWAGKTDVTDTGTYLNWSNCPYHTGLDECTGWTKYNFISSYGTVDNKSVLDLSDDAAYVNCGDAWRTPTYADWIDLRENCSWKWTSISGINGYKVTSNKPGYSSAYIFLPAAGYRDGSNMVSRGSYGYYWSSTLNPSSSYYVWDVGFYSMDIGMSNRYRYRGQSVRPVCE